MRIDGVNKFSVQVTVDIVDLLVMFTVAMRHFRFHETYKNVSLTTTNVSLATRFRLADATKNGLLRAVG